MIRIIFARMLEKVENGNGAINHPDRGRAILGSGGRGEGGGRQLTRRGLL